MNIHPAPAAPPMGAPTPNKSVLYPWGKWFAWHPVIVHDKPVWLKMIYRRKIRYRDDMNLYYGYRYGTIFDVLAE